MFALTRCHRAINTPVTSSALVESRSLSPQHKTLSSVNQNAASLPYRVPCVETTAANTLAVRLKVAQQPKEKMTVHRNLSVNTIYSDHAPACKTGGPLLL